MHCPNCGSTYVNVQAVAERKKRGCLMAGLWVLLAILTFGAIIWIPILIRKGDKVRSWAVCQSCGYKWVIDRPVAYAPAPASSQPVLSNEPRFDTLVPNVQRALTDILDIEVGVSENERDWMITRSGLNYTLRSNVRIESQHKPARVEIAFPDETYDTFRVTGLQIDGNIIDV